MGLPFRIRYLFRRAMRLSPRNLFAYATEVGKVSRAPRIAIIADMLWCAARYDFVFQDYVLWDIRLLSAAERRTWMTMARSFRYSREVNTPDALQRLASKLSLYTDFADLLGRPWVDIDTASDTEWAAFLKTHPRFMAKPVSLSGGQGVEVVELADGESPEQVRQRMRDAGQRIAEELLVQHPDLHALHPGSVNTVRMITYLDESSDTVHRLARVLRIGNGAAIDNFASGGMYTLLDEHGIAMYPGVDKTGTGYASHPVSGVRIEGFAVPNLDVVEELVEVAARRIPGARYVGWDIAVTASGAVLIEANDDSSVFQPKPTVTGVRTGLLPVYRAAIGY